MVVFDTQHNCEEAERNAHVLLFQAHMSACVWGVCERDRETDKDRDREKGSFRCVLSASQLFASATPWTPRERSVADLFKKRWVPLKVEDEQ